MIYLLAERLGLVFEVWKNDVYIGKYRFIDGKLFKYKN